MYNVRKMDENLYWVGVNDRRTSLFENIHPIPEGIAYNSYLSIGDKTVLLDTVDSSVCNTFINNVKHVLDGRPLDYLIINHMEPDHAACVGLIESLYPDVRIIGNKKTFELMIKFGFEVKDNAIEVKDNESISLGEQQFTFLLAPMVHWPETMATLDSKRGILYSADAFGTFGALNGRLFNDEVDFESEYLLPARRYYTNIVGKYGPQVQNLLKKTHGHDIRWIAPLHGPVWRNNLEYLIDKYDKWSAYNPEEKGVLIVYGSMYGNTEQAAEDLARRLTEKGMSNISMYDASSTHVSYLVADAFKYSHIVLASATYNLNIFPPIQNFIESIKAVNLQNRTFAIVANGSWAPAAKKLMRELVETMPNTTILDNEILITSSMKQEDIPNMDALADAVIASMK